MTGTEEAELPNPAAAPAAQGRAASSARHSLHPGELLQAAAALLKEPGFWLRLWAAGAGIHALWFLLGYARFRRGLRHTLRPPLPTDLELYNSLQDWDGPWLYRSGAVTTPMLVGLLRPILLLPDRAYSREMLSGILRHELIHYRRRDIARKWFAVLVTVIHWFNPVTRLLRRELDRACELACDEVLLRRMDVEEKRGYGEMLLKLAAERTLPSSVVATSFAIEKRNLKERLLQIMTYKKTSRAGLALAAILLLTGCAGALGPGSATPAEEPVVTEAPPPTPMPTPTAAPLPSEGKDWAEELIPTAVYENSVTVTTVDEFLDAIAPDTQILLQPGTYDLSTAKNYGQELDDGYYTWEEVYDGYQLVIREVESLAILGGGTEDVTIAAVPRYANVLAFRGCSSPLVMRLTAGHTQEPGYCSGGVLDFESCSSPYVLDCALYGCGTLGVYAGNCRSVTVRDTEIYECSFGAVWAYGCYDVQVDGCSIHHCGTRSELGFNAMYLFNTSSTTGFAVINSEITRNNTQILLNCDYSQEVYLLNCGVENNTVTNYVFQIDGAPPVVDGCAFTGNKVESWYPADYRGYAVNPDGEELISFDLERMQRKEAAYDGVKKPTPVTLSGSLAADGVTTEYHVSTVDEFLSVIGPDTTIYLDAERFDLSTAGQYGGYGSQYYYWAADFDGPTLVITGVSNFRIVGQGKDKTEIVAVPRYADVLRFISGENISLEGFTAGHTDTGDCSGDVLGFENITNLSIADCGLYGCGVWGIRANLCYNLEVRDTEIYSCSNGAFTMYHCNYVTMEGIDIHDMPSTVTAYIDDCDEFLYEGRLMGSGGHKL